MLTPGSVTLKPSAARLICLREPLTTPETSGRNAFRPRSRVGARGANVLVALEEPEVVLEGAIERVLQRKQERRVHGLTGRDASENLLCACPIGWASLARGNPRSAIERAATMPVRNCLRRQTVCITSIPSL